MALNCNNSIEIDFLSDLVVDATMHCVTIPSQITEFSIAVNTDHLNTSLETVTVPLVPEKVIVVDECLNSTVTISNVDLIALKAKGIIHYVVGANLLLSSENVSVTPSSYMNGWITVPGNVPVDAEFLAYLDDENTPYSISVNTKDIEIQIASFAPETDQHIYRITGTFVVAVLPV